MKEPIAIIFNDAHSKPGNEHDLLRATKHMIGYAEEQGIDKVIFAGDWFDSRSFQRESVLQLFNTVLRLFNEAGITLYLFPGNHDKTLYNSYDSFLDSFRYHPGVIFNRDISRIEIEGVKIDLLPFFSDDMLIPKIEEAEGADILISHFEIEGSTHLGSISKKVTINKKLLSKWKKVYLGHYHNHHEITKDIVHLPSFIQDNFGEDDKKGFSVLYDDLSYELIQGGFKKYIKVEIDVDQTSSKDINSLIKQHSGSDDVIRFEFSGETSKLKSLDKSVFKDTGIDIKIKFKDSYEETLVAQADVIQKFDKGDIYEIFEEFCEEKSYDVKEGLELLNKFFKTDG